MRNSGRARRSIHAVVLSGLVVGLPARAPAQAAPDSGGVHVALGFGVDTSRSPTRDIFHLWRAYLADRPDSLHPSPYWSRAEQAQYSDFDLLRAAVYQGFRKITVVQLAPSPGLDSTYVIRTLISGVYGSTSDVKPLALFRVYAVRERDRWVLANALPRLTRDWTRTTIGHVTFVYPPSRAFNRGRARNSANFVDSLAAAFGLPIPNQIGYYFTDNLTDTFRAIGLDFFPTGPDTAGGRSLARDNLVFVGSSTDGEGNRHELAHIVFVPLTGPRTHRLVSEGLATWTGGSAGLSFGYLLPGLKRYVQEHPGISLDSVITNPPMREGTLDVGYDGFAVLCAMVYARGGVLAIRDLASAGTSPSDVLDTAARLLGVPRADLDSVWRRKVLSYGH
jgi:hypothetical protein